ncbi:p6.9 [Sucra jujuba nucleopolyhedrovirus]|uniref:p6.9 n=1 Tax=Sucra jujuba nucleopolyhedrovirus TaxID=1563660 RepID=A0A097P915_9ABAC|nr:p6.9 [Sucra jujuba nucleopolyhedrovirus]AIU41322.1 p6.9 [Sucra jujuba nucleopolyhedrovirus]
MDSKNANEIACARRKTGVCLWNCDGRADDRAFFCNYFRRSCCVCDRRTICVSCDLRKIGAYRLRLMFVCTPCLFWSLNTTDETLQF